MKAYVIQHEMVGVHRKGDIVTFSAEQTDKGINVKRLLGLQAIREADDDESKAAVTYGVGGADLVVGPPPVPFESSVAPQNAQGYPNNPHEGDPALAAMAEQGNLEPGTTNAPPKSRGKSK